MRKSKVILCLLGGVAATAFVVPSAPDSPVNLCDSGIRNVDYSLVGNSHIFNITAEGIDSTLEIKESYRGIFLTGAEVKHAKDSFCLGNEFGLPEDRSTNEPIYAPNQPRL